MNYLEKVKIAAIKLLNAAKGLPCGFDYYMAGAGLAATENWHLNITIDWGFDYKDCKEKNQIHLRWCNGDNYTDGIDLSNKLSEDGEKWLSQRKNTYKVLALLKSLPGLLDRISEISDSYKVE